MDDLISRQAAIETIRKLPNAGIHWLVSAEAVFDALLKLPLAQPEPRWTPVTEGLPKKNVWVYVTFMMANGKIDIDIMRINRWNNAWETHDFDMAYRETVVAWMPLPEPYKEEKK